MNLANNDCYPTPCSEKSVGAFSRPSLKEQLESQKAELEARLSRINAALEALNSHPEVMMVLELVSRV